MKSQTTTDRFHCSQFCPTFEPEPERLDFTITSTANKHNLVEQTTSVHFWRLTGEHPGSITLCHDLPSIPKNCSPQCYVDDTKLLMSFQQQDKEEAITRMNQDLLMLRNWCFSNQLLLNCPIWQHTND